MRQHGMTIPCPNCGQDTYSYYYDVRPAIWQCSNCTFIEDANEYAERHIREHLWPLTLEEAVEAVRAFMEETPDALALMRALNVSDAIMYHHSLGQWIRNTFGLWQGNLPLIRACHKENESVPADECSHVIIEAFMLSLKAEGAGDVVTPEQITHVWEKPG